MKTEHAEANTTTAPSVGSTGGSALFGCPFCGKQPEYLHRASEYTHTGEVHFLACYCGGHSARAHQMGVSASDVAERWNTRKPNPKDEPRGPKFR